MSILDEMTPKEITVSYQKTEQVTPFHPIQIGITETWQMPPGKGDEDVADAEEIILDQIMETVDDTMTKKLKELRNE